ATNGTVAPPSSSATVASTCCSRTPSSSAICLLMFATRDLSEAVAAGESLARERTLMDHRGLVHQPAARNKLICGWTSFVFEVMRFCKEQLACIIRQDTR